jgi:enoyl-CoA hydratase/carnithine racemase
VHEIIGPLVRLKAPELLMFTRMTGDLVKAMRACPQPIVAAVDGVCAGAGAIVAMASDLRLGTAAQQRPPSCSTGWAWPAATWAPAPCCADHRPGPRSELLYTGRSFGCEERRALGLLQPPARIRRAAGRGAGAGAQLAEWPTFRQWHHLRTMLHQEWAMTLEQAIEARAQAQGL